MRGSPSLQLHQERGDGLGPPPNHLQDGATEGSQKETRIGIEAERSPVPLPASPPSTF